MPLFRIDEGMAKAAVEEGNRIGVLATLCTTLVPTVDLLKRLAAEGGKDVVIDDVLVQGVTLPRQTGPVATFVMRPL